MQMEKTPLHISLEDNMQELQKRFGESGDLYVKPICIRGVACAVCMFDGITSTEKLWVTLLDALRHPVAEAADGEELFAQLMQHSDLPLESSPVADWADMTRRLTAGMAVLLLEGCAKGLAVSVQAMQHRGVQEPAGEGNMRGSREGFADLVRVNVSLLRRLVRTESCTVEYLYAGERTRTEIALCYDRALADPALVRQVRARLQKLRLPLLLDSGYLAPFLQKNGFSFFDEVGYTERPATACAKLCEGKVILLVNGSPFALILPYFFVENFESLDDYAFKAYFCSFVRLLKYAAFLLAVLLPGVFVSVASYTPELLPPDLLYKVEAAQQGTPWPLFLEMLLVILLLEIVREAGLRLPKPIGHSVGLVAALIVGDASIAAGLLSTPVVVVGAITTLSIFVIPALYQPATVLRILFVLAGGLLGPLGITALFFVMLLSIAGRESFGWPYASPLSPPSGGLWRDGLIRLSWKALAERPFSVEDLPGGAQHGR